MSDSKKITLFLLTNRRFFKKSFRIKFLLNINSNFKNEFTILKKLLLLSFYQFKSKEFRI
jgi:hypothetical protein